MNFGGVHFAPREFQIVELIAQGLKNKEIAVAVGMVDGTVRNYVKVIFDKTGMGNRVELAIWYLAHRGDHAL